MPEKGPYRFVGHAGGILWLAAMVSCATAHGGPNGQFPPSVQSVRKGVATRDAAIQNLSARITYNERSRVSRAGPFRERVQVIDALWKDFPEARIDMLEEPAYSLGWRTKERIIMTANANGARRLNRARRRDPREPDGLEREGSAMGGQIVKEPGLFWAIHPSQLLGLGTWSVNNYLQGTKMEAPRIETIGNQETLRLEWYTESMNPPGSALRGAIWLAPQMGFAVIQAETSRRPSPNSPWRVIAKTESKGFVRVANTWLPEGVKHVEHAYWDNGEYELKRELTASFEDWKLNQPLDDSVFRLEFPKGTVVTDHTRNSVTYVKGQEDDPKKSRNKKPAPNPTRE